MSKHRRVTIREIAKEAGVSMQTVSRVINNRPDVAPETRRRVNEIIATRDYRPSSIARGLSKGRSYILGVIVSGIKYFGPSRALSGIEKQASEMGYAIILRAVHQSEVFDIDEYLRFLINQHVDGIVWAMPEHGNIRREILEKIPGLDLPAVFINLEPHPDLTVFDFDNFDGGRIATEHLIDQGYRNIGLITGPMDWMVARQRRRGWEEALRSAGLAANDEQIVEGDWTAGSGEQAMTRLFNEWPAVDAVFASNDMMALGAMKAARNIGRFIPGELGLIGFDDVPEASYFCPALSTIRQNTQDLGCRSIVAIDQMIANRSRGEMYSGEKANIFRQELIVRESSLKSLTEP